MATDHYRIESNHPIVGMLWPAHGMQQYQVSDRALAVALAAKSFSDVGDEIRVVHVPTGEVVFRKTSAHPSGLPDES